MRSCCGPCVEAGGIWWKHCGSWIMSHIMSWYVMICHDMSWCVVICRYMSWSRSFSHLFASLNYVRHCSTSLKKHSRLWDGMEKHGMDSCTEQIFGWISCMAHGVSWQMHVELTWVDINLESLKLVATHCHPLSRCDFFEALFIRWLLKVVPKRSVVPHRDGTAHILTSERFKVQKLCHWLTCSSAGLFAHGFVAQNLQTGPVALCSLKQQRWQVFPQLILCSRWWHTLCFQGGMDSLRSSGATWVQTRYALR